MKTVNRILTGVIVDTDAIKEKIEADLSKTPEHGKEIKTVLTSPVRETFEGVDGKKQQLWIVGKYEEYYLTFDESSRRYGLGYKTIMNEPVLLSEEGSIGEAYDVLMNG